MAQLVEHGFLPTDVGGRAICLGKVERDVAAGKCLEYAWCKTGKPQPPFDKAHRQAEAPRDVFDTGPRCHDARKSLGFIGRVHDELVEVFSETCFARGAFVGIEHEAGHRHRFGNGLVDAEGMKCLQAASACLDLEAPAMSGANHEVLEEATRADIGFQLGIGHIVMMPPHIARGRHELV